MSVLPGVPAQHGRGGALPSVDKMGGFQEEECGEVDLKNKQVFHRAMASQAPEGEGIG